MIPTATAPRWGRFSIASLPRAQQLRAWHEFVHATFVDVQVQPTVGDDFQAAADFGEIDGLRLGTIRSTRSLVEHRRAQRSGEPFFVLHLQEQGVCLHQQGRQATALRPGEFSLSDMGRPYRIEQPDDTGMLIAVLPARALEARVPGVHDLVCRTVRRDLRAGAALAAMLRSVMALGGAGAGPCASRGAARRHRARPCGRSLAAVAAAGRGPGSAPPPSPAHRGLHRRPAG